MLIIRNLNLISVHLISVHSWTYLELASTVASGNCYHPNSSAVSHEKQIHTTIPDAIELFGRYVKNQIYLWYKPYLCLGVLDASSCCSFVSSILSIDL